MSVGRYGRGQCMTVDQVGTTNQLRRALGSNVGTFFMGFACHPALDLDLCFYAGTTVQIEIFQRDTQLQIYRGISTQLATSVVNTVPTGWYHIQVGGKIHATAGWIQVKVNGVTVVEVYGVDTNNTAAAYTNIVGLSGVVDDLWFCDDTVGAGAHPNNTYLGDVSVETLFPTAIDSAQFSTTGVDNVRAVQGTMDGDGGYNFSSTANEVDLFAASDIPTSATVYGVSVKGQYRVDAGTRGAYNLLKTGSFTAVGALKALTGTYALQQDVFPVNPDTGAAWTVSEVNAMKIGYKTGA